MPVPLSGRTTRARRLRLPRLLALLTLIAAALLLSAPAASAHATLLLTTPQAGSSVAQAPDTLTLTFNEPVNTTTHAVRLTDVQGKPAPLGATQRAADGRTLRAALKSAPPAGVYLVQWQVTASDGDTMAGSYRFAIGPADAGLTTAPAATATPGQATTTALRWVLFTALAIAVGGAATRPLFALRAGPAGPTQPKARTQTAIWIGAAAALGLAALVVGEGSLPDGLPQLTPAQLTASIPGTLAAVEVLAFVAAALLARTRRPTWSLLPLTAVAIAEGLRGHPEAAAAGWGAALTTVHLLAAALWTGALVHTLRTARAWRDHPHLARTVVNDYARVALTLVLLVIATGTIATLVMIRRLGDLTSTGWGLALLAKLALVAAAALLAFLARRRVTDPAKRLSMWSAARAEAGILAAVLALSSLLTALAPPRTSADTAYTLPPAPNGPVIAVGTRAGEIGIHAQASRGRLVLNLSAPGTDPANPPRANVRLTATAATPGHTPRPLTLRPCGPACFTTPLTWRDGTTVLGLHAQATGWTGGNAAFSIPWPAKPAPAALRRVTTAMRNAGPVTLYEQTTSDTSRPLAKPTRLDLTGRRFLDAEPYTDGRATVVNQADTGPDGTTFLLGYPAERIEIRLLTAPDGRILRETLTAPNHLIERTFVYPERTEDEHDGSHTDRR
ncbi:copper resistance protein CopC [Streptomyces caniferus]|uniref:copper resistance CopC/CopD family protein n=1 Tax=Streptomyces caniferus TaxID=285557 RepID=UPI002E2CBDB3|nr:copper resistance protein CopC [Streptomyces caniferus]